MKNLVVNIGLNVGNEEPTNQLFQTTDILSHLFDFHADFFRIHEGQWEDDEGDIIEERVLVAEFNVGGMTEASIRILLEAVCEGLSQEAIAFKLNGVGHVAYSGTYKGKKFKFNREYFKTL